MESCKKYLWYHEPKVDQHVMIQLQQNLISNIIMKNFHGCNKLPSGYSLYINVNPLLVSEDYHNAILDKI